MRSDPSTINKEDLELLLSRMVSSSRHTWNLVNDQKSHYKYYHITARRIRPDRFNLHFYYNRVDKIPKYHTRQFTTISDTASAIKKKLNDKAKRGYVITDEYHHISDKNGIYTVSLNSISEKKSKGSKTKKKAISSQKKETTNDQRFKTLIF